MIFQKISQSASERWVQIASLVSSANPASRTRPEKTIRMKHSFTNPYNSLILKAFSFLLVVRHETNLFEVRICSHDTYESMDLRNESMFLQISYTIPASLVFCHLNFYIIEFPLNIKWLVNMIGCLI
jgi:hypothetical protein